MIKDYKKWMNESTSNMDPYGEEDWNGETTREIVMDDDDNYYDTMEQVPRECRICGEYIPNSLMEDGICPDCKYDENHCKICDNYTPNQFLTDGICKRCLKDPNQYD